MEYFKASEDHAEQIYNLVQNTITVVYPRYYPEAVVDFFCSLHNRTNITRVFVAPEFQGQGYGRRIMENLEREIAREYPSICLDASLPAAHFYESRGYKTVRHGKTEVENNAILVYEVMEKQMTKNL